MDFWLPLTSFILYSDGMKASELISPVYYASAFGFDLGSWSGKGFFTKDEWAGWMDLALEARHSALPFEVLVV